MAFVGVRGAGSGAAQEGFRWAGLEASTGGGGELFPGLVRREFGKGEFRGLEFFEVEARRIVNEVPAASMVPFRYTINAYRGCSHACTYCLDGDTPVLMGDTSTKPLRDVRAGDLVYGTTGTGAARRYVVTQVLDHWSTVKAAWRVTLDGGVELVAGGDHRLLTPRGWKYVTGAARGSGRRPHLTPANRLVGPGPFAAPPDEDADYRRGYLGGVVHLAAGDGAGDGDAAAPAPRLSLSLVDPEALGRASTYLRAQGVTTDLVGGKDARAWARAAADAIAQAVAWPVSPSPSWTKGFLAGAFDAAGEAGDAREAGGAGGAGGAGLRIRARGAVIEHVRAALDRLGFGHEQDGRAATGAVRLTGGPAEHLRFLHTVAPAVTAKRSIEGAAVHSDARLQVVSVEPTGAEIPMYDITTGTGDFVADGVVSHNCFARPTHEYLNLDIGRDFETKIVVKVNAVERLRAELRPSRWAGEHIAMGTNTDPYQRAEGKYRLTRGIVEVLAEHRNPFSILTKSSLVLRDIDLLVEAAARTSVAANFSIGTLDDDVWKLTEPGTPHPRQRVEAVAKLNAAGVPCGVLVAPILPGISDGDEQLDAVVGACVAAGARSISATTLHLRPGVRQHYLGWLRERRPDLMRRYRDIYRRGSYAPKELQRRIAEKVATAVERHGGIAAAPGDARRVPARPVPARPDPPAEQLTF